MWYWSDNDTDEILIGYRFCHRWNTCSIPIRYRYWWYTYTYHTDTDEIPIRYLSRTIWNSYPPWTEMFRTRLWTWYGENEQTAAEWWAFSRPRLSVGGASERRIAAKWANGCRVVLIFGIVQNPLFYQGFRARRDIDFKKTSKRLQSGAHFEYCAAFTSRSRRVRSRWREDVPKCLKINRWTNKAFLILFGAPRDMSVKNIDLAWEWSTFH